MFLMHFPNFDNWTCCISSSGACWTPFRVICASRRYPWHFHKNSHAIQTIQNVDDSGFESGQADRDACLVPLMQPMKPVLELLSLELQSEIPGTVSATECQLTWSPWMLIA